MPSGFDWRALRAGVQVLAVTHAPQVAARAEHHYLITKDAFARGKRVADPGGRTGAGAAA